MDLALELGMSSEVLARTMTERELRRWVRYVQRKLLPTRRLEVYLAQIAQMIAITMGGAKDAKISDYLIEIEAADAVSVDDIDVEDVREAFDFNPRNRKD
jgi:hypothetical protein